jgi:hypothetical protein
MADERLAALQAEIEAKQREVERIIAEEAKKNTVPPLIEALEEVLRTQEAADEAAAVARAAYVASQGDQSGKQAALATQARERARPFLEKLASATNDGERDQWRRLAEKEEKDALMWETADAHGPFVMRSAAAKDMMLKALLVQAREDAETKRANADMFESMLAQIAALQTRVTTMEGEKESMLAQIAALQTRVTTIEGEKAAKDRLAEETIRSLGYITTASTGY